MDYGESRIGLAKSDSEAILASPVATLLNNDDVLTHVLELIPDSCLEIYVGLPLNLHNDITVSTKSAVSFAIRLAAQTNKPVRLIDERLTTSIANSQLRELGINQKKARANIDQLAAVAILEYALNMERNTGIIPGKSLDEWIKAND